MVNLNYKQKQFLKKHYCNSEIKKEDMLVLFNKQFKTKLTYYMLREYLYHNGIKKKKEIIIKMSGRKRPAYSKDACNFIIECAKQGMTRSECKSACQDKYLIPFSLKAIQDIAQERKACFNLVKRQNRLDLVFDTPKIEKCIVDCLKHNSEVSYQDVCVRDMIIIKFKKNIPLEQIRNYCKVNQINIKSMAKDNYYKPPIILEDEEKLWENELEY